jgi:hypothetical protein
MPRLLDRMPFSESPTEIVARGERIRIRRDQIILWISLTTKQSITFNPFATPFPAILDIGHNHVFSILEQHLIEWAGLRPETLPIVGAVRERGQRLHLRAAKVWVHVNVPRSRDRLVERPPFPLSAARGIAVYPSTGGFPRLPILGLGAIAENKLILEVNGKKREATLRTPFRWWPFV